MQNVTQVPFSQFKRQLPKDSVYYENNETFDGDYEHHNVVVLPGDTVLDNPDLDNPFGLYDRLDPLKADFKDP